MIMTKKGKRGTGRQIESVEELIKHPIKNKNDLKKFVKREINGGKTRRDLFQEIRKYYDSEHSLAVMIGEFPEVSLKKKYRFRSIILGLLLIAMAVSHFYLFFRTIEGDPDVYYELAVLPLVLIFIAVWVFQFILFAMRIAPLAAYGTMIFLVYGLAKNSPDGKPDVLTGIPFLIGFASSLIVVWLAGFLKKKLMPGYGIMGPGRDHEGNYRF